MKNNNRTRGKPMFTTDRPTGPTWTWEVTFGITTAGYANICAVTASRGLGKSHIQGRVYTDLRFDDDPMAAAEVLLWEACIDASEQHLPGSDRPEPKFVDVRPNLISRAVGDRQQSPARNPLT